MSYILQYHLLTTKFRNEGTAIQIISDRLTLLYALQPYTHALTGAELTFIWKWSQHFKWSVHFPLKSGTKQSTFFPI